MGRYRRVFDCPDPQTAFDIVRNWKPKKVDAVYSTFIYGDRDGRNGDYHQLYCMLMAKNKGARHWDIYNVNWFGGDSPELSIGYSGITRTFSQACVIHMRRMELQLVTEILQRHGAPVPEQLKQFKHFHGRPDHGAWLFKRRKHMQGFHYIDHPRYRQAVDYWRQKRQNTPATKNELASQTPPSL